MPLQFPLNGVTAPRAEHFTGRAKSLAELRGFQGMRDAQAVQIRGLGYFTFAPGSPADLTRALSGARDPSDANRVAAVNAPRFALEDMPGGLMANGGGTGVGSSWGLGAEDGLLIEPLRENRAANGIGGSNYATGAATGTRVTGTDPIVGATRRLVKTGGASADRWGISTSGTALNAGGIVYACGMLVRPWNQIGEVTIYTDADSTPGPFSTTSISVPLSRLVQGEWNLILVRGATAGEVLSGTFTTYAWLQNGVGGDCEIAQITTLNGDVCWLGATVADANTSAAADVPVLTPTVAFSGASGMVTSRIYVPAAHVGLSILPTRVYWQRRAAADGFRVATETGANNLTMTMTNGGNTTTIDLPFSGLSAGWHTVAWRWDQASGVMAAYLDGALVQAVTGLASGFFPAAVVGGSILLGHSGAGAESLQGAIGWVTHHPADPGATEALAASASADPRHTAANQWNFRQRSGFRLSVSDDGQTVILPSGWHGIWRQTGTPSLVVPDGVEALARVRRLEAVMGAQGGLGDVEAITKGLVGLRGKASPTLGTVNAGIETSFDVSVPGAEAGMLAVAAPPSSLNAGISLRGAVVSAPGIVTVYLRNDTVGSIAINAGTWLVSVRKGVA